MQGAQRLGESDPDQVRDGFITKLESRLLQLEKETSLKEAQKSKV